MLSHRNTQVVDACIGVDGEDIHTSTLTGDHGIYISKDGHRRTDELLNLGHARRKRRLKLSGLRDHLAEWVPVEEHDADGAEEIMDSVGSEKRKRYESSDDPMNGWRPLRQMFLDETMRRHGLGDLFGSPECALCDCSVGGVEEPRFFRCASCGEFLQCKSCCVKHHQLSPLHLVEEWKVHHWEKTTLSALGLVYQVGHGGMRCLRPAPIVRNMVVIDTTGVHSVKFRYCGCARADHANNLRQLLRNAWYPASITDPATCATFRVLDLFRMLNVVGNVNAHDFITSLERLTAAAVSSGMDKMPDRYKQFIRMARQYAFLQRNDAGGLAATALGELMVMCWACPHDGRNLPQDWRDVAPKYRFLYMLLLAIDANFKLKNRIRKNEIYDPSLGPGLGAFVEPAGYKEHISNYVGEEDISTCIAFAALLQKDTRNTVGLRVSGVGGCVCARHECMRPNGLGDLQKGERYANMDYIVMSALRGFSGTQLTLSYDIACQWKRNLEERMGKLPEDLQLDLDEIELQCGLPVWHASSHESDCQNENSLSFLVGVGKTDGEGIERFWSLVNQIAFFTKDAGLGTRADAVEDKVDSHNYLKNIGQGDALLRKLIIAVAERARQVAAFREVDRSISSEVRAVWQKKVDDFLDDRSKPNPYVMSQGDGPTEAEIRLSLRKEEEKDSRARGVPVHATSATAFLVAGLQLEGMQRRIKVEAAGMTIVTADREGKLQETRMSFFVKLRTFRTLQAIYTPAAVRAAEQEEYARDHDAQPAKAENVRLWMPSELSAAQRGEGCARGLPEMEVKLREAQCSDALTTIRQRLHAKRHLIGYRDKNVTGQVRATKARTLISQIGERATASAEKYRRARKALSALKGAAHAPHFKELTAADMTLDGEVGDTGDIAARKKLALAGVGKKGRLPRHMAGSTRKVLSWIWTAGGVEPSEDDEEMALHESVRVEWSRAQARKIRWEEEVTLLREEMRRVLRYLAWLVNWWTNHAEAAGGEERMPDMESGLRGYAMKQVAHLERLAAFFRGRWSLSTKGDAGGARGGARARDT
ncbi:hypothetical protein DFH09DRAFT_1250900 [Mycena vulgaris]|nr:hypothetical protein DFH09DRAFT_1250900 [Mycena vulgaris]